MYDTNKDAASTLNELFRGEISAVETYRQALDKVGADQPEVEQMRRLMREHSEAAGKLRDLVLSAGGTPAKDSGPWGTLAKAVEKTATLLGDKVALKALKEGEEHGLKCYTKAVDGDLMPEATTLIRDRLLARQREHIRVLDDLIARA